MENNFSRFVVFLLHKALLLAGDPVKLLSPCDSPGQSHPAAQSPDKEPKAFAKCTQIGGEGGGIGGRGGGDRREGIGGHWVEKGEPYRGGGRRCGVAELGVPAGRGWGVGTMEDPIEVGVGGSGVFPHRKGGGMNNENPLGVRALPQPPFTPTSLSVHHLHCEERTGHDGGIEGGGVIPTPTPRTPPPSGKRA